MKKLLLAGVFSSWAGCSWAQVVTPPLPSFPSSYVGIYCSGVVATSTYNPTGIGLCPASSGGGGGGSVTQGTTPWADNITQFGGANVATGTGASGAGIPRVTVSNDSSVNLGAGANLVGKVGIDQTTPGTTNLVQEPSYAALTQGTAATAINQTIFTITPAQTVGYRSIHYGLTGTFVATANLQISIDGGTTWLNIAGSNAATGQTLIALTAPAALSYPVSPGATYRMVVSAYTSGSVNAVYSLSTGDAAAPLIQSGTLATVANQTATLGPIAAGAAPTNDVVAGCVNNTTPPTLTTGQAAAVQCDTRGQPRVQAPVLTLNAGTSSTLTTGGTAATVVTGPVNGCQIVNPLSLTDQGIAAAEVAYLNPVTTATAVGNGTNVTLQPGQPWNCPGAVTGSISVIAATSGHRLSVIAW